MSISNGTKANATNFNAAFVSRSAAQSVAGGKTFSNYVAETPADVATSATILAMSSSTSNVRMTGSTATTVQGITAGVSGQCLRIYNASSAVVTLSNQNGTASADNRFSSYSGSDVPLAAGATIYLRYDSTLSRWVQDTNAVGATASGGGGINYITDTDGSTIGSWVTFADAAGTSPVDGTGGSPVSTFAVSTDSSLAGTTNFIFTKGAANRQGEGFSVPFSIDAGYQAKPLKITALYKIASGTFVDNDMSVWVYDVTNSALIACTPQFINNSTGVEQISAEFQAAYNSTSYRLIFHVGSTSASAYTLRFDSVSVSPITYSRGAFVSDWVDYTPTFTGFGTATSISFKYRRVGSSMEVLGKFTQGTNTSTEARISFPSGFTSDSILPSISIAGTAARAESDASSVYVLREPSVSYFTLGVQSVARASLTKINGDYYSNTSTVSIIASVPILGWGTSQILSSETDTRIVAAQSELSPSSQSVNSSTFTALNFPTTTFDTNGAITSTSPWTYTVRIPGYYNVSVSARATVALTGQDIISVYKNGSEVKRLFDNAGVGGSLGGMSGSGLVSAIAGDTIQIYVYHSTGSARTFDQASVSINRLSGPAQIAASEKVYLQYTNNGGTSITAGVTNLDFTTKVVDSHGAWNGTVFTAPRAGFYQVNGSTLLTASVAMNAHIYKGGVDTISISNASSLSQKAFNGGIYLNSGETISIRADQNCTLSNNAVVHWISISSQG